MLIQIPGSQNKYSQRYCTLCNSNVNSNNNNNRNEEISHTKLIQSLNSQYCCNNNDNNNNVSQVRIKNIESIDDINNNNNNNNNNTNNKNNNRNTSSLQHGRIMTANMDVHQYDNQWFLDMYNHLSKHHECNSNSNNNNYSMGNNIHRCIIIKHIIQEIIEQKEHLIFQQRV